MSSDRIMQVPYGERLLKVKNENEYADNILNCTQYWHQLRKKRFNHNRRFNRRFALPPKRGYYWLNTRKGH